MTKHVRIENADTSNYKVKVEVWEASTTGPLLVETIELPYPTSLTSLYITSTRYLVIKELPNNV